MNYWQVGVGASGVLVAIMAGLWYHDNQSHQAAIAELELEKTTLETSLAAERALLATTTQSFEAQIEALTDSLTASEDDRKELQSDLRAEKDRNDEFEEQIEEIAGTVTVLDKLSKTDEELLQKYSKVYFLNEHYIPENLTEIDPEWKYSESKPNALHGRVMPFFEDMVEDALEDGVELWVVSAYRSYDQQAQIKSNYLITYGAGANAFSADQGFSEHQLGTTIDFTTRGMNGGLTEAFENTEAFTWLEDNAHKYGFVLSYPRDNAYYIYEPWHWRFVGTDLAKDLRRDDAHFYDWDQRDIDEYLVNIFD